MNTATHHIVHHTARTLCTGPVSSELIFAACHLPCAVCTVGNAIFGLHTSHDTVIVNNMVPSSAKAASATHRYMDMATVAVAACLLQEISDSIIEITHMHRHTVTQCCRQRAAAAASKTLRFMLDTLHIQKQQQKLAQADMLPLGRRDATRALFCIIRVVQCREVSCCCPVSSGRANKWLFQTCSVPTCHV